VGAFSSPNPACDETEPMSHRTAVIGLLVAISEHLVYQSEIPSTTITLSAAFGK